MGAPTMGTDLGAARSSLASACARVTDAGPADAVDGVLPALVARPGSTVEVADVLRAAAAAGLTVVPRGHGTKMTWGRPPERVDVVVDVSGMSAVLDHAAGDLIVQTQAGTALTAVQDVVSGAGQRLALDDPVGGSSIGGALATNLSGPGRLAGGTARDLLIGVTLVRADGVVAKAGGRVVKNVAGYDLGKLMIGSFGTLAVITEAFFRLHPRAASRRVVSVPVDRPHEAQRLVQQLLHAQVVPAAIEIEWTTEGTGRVDVLLEGTEAGVQGRSAAAARLLGATAPVEDGLPDRWGTFPWADAGQDRTTALTAPVPQATALKATAVKATFSLSGLARVLATADTAAADAGVRVTLRGSAGTGVLYGALPADAAPAAVGSVVALLREECTALGGALVVLDGPAEVKAAIDTWGPVPALDLMRRVKHQFDPERRLAPGRFVGGI